MADGVEGGEATGHAGRTGQQAGGGDRRRHEHRGQQEHADEGEHAAADRRERLLAERADEHQGGAAEEQHDAEQGADHAAAGADGDLRDRLQRLQRRDPGGGEGRGQGGQHGHEHAHAHGDQQADRVRAEGQGRQVQGLAQGGDHHEGQAHGQQGAEHRADEADHEALEQHGAADLPLRGAEGAQQREFAGALGHENLEGIGDDQRGHQEREGGEPAEHPGEHVGASGGVGQGVADGLVRGGDARGDLLLGEQVLQALLHGTGVRAVVEAEQHRGGGLGVVGVRALRHPVQLGHEGLGGPGLRQGGQARVGGGVRQAHDLHLDRLGVRPAGLQGERRADAQAEAPGGGGVHRHLAGAGLGGAALGQGEVGEADVPRQGRQGGVVAAGRGVAALRGAGHLDVAGLDGEGLGHAVDPPERAGLVGGAGQLGQALLCRRGVRREVGGLQRAVGGLRQGDEVRLRVGGAEGGAQGGLRGGGDHEGRGQEQGADQDGQHHGHVAARMRAQLGQGDLQHGVLLTGASRGRRPRTRGSDR